MYYLNRSITNNEIRSIIKNLPTKKSSGFTKYDLEKWRKIESEGI
jgi:hypothetical protein